MGHEDRQRQDLEALFVVWSCLRALGDTGVAMTERQVRLSTGQRDKP